MARIQHWCAFPGTKSVPQPHKLCGKQCACGIYWHLFRFGKQCGCGTYFPLLADARQHLAAGQFDRGSMGPKIEAMIAFVAGGGEGIMTDPAHLSAALSGRAGTRIGK